MWRKLTPLVVGAALLLTGCGGAVELDADAAKHLRATAYSVAELSSAGDPGGALVALADLEEDLAGAEADGTVSAKKAQSIRAVIDLVRAQLQPSEPVFTDPLPPTVPEAPSAVAPVDPAPSAPDAAVDTGTAATGTAETGTVEAGTVDAGAADTGSDSGKGNGNGNGGGNGKGNGKGNGNDR